MLVELKGLAVDIGGSEPRVKSSKADPRVHSNKLYKLNTDEFRLKEGSEKPEELFEVVKATNPNFLGMYAVGVTGQLYSAEATALSSQENKTDSETFYMQLLYAVATEALLLKQREVLDQTYTKEEAASIAYDFMMTVCIPVKEHTGNLDCAKVLKEKIQGTYTVKFPSVGEGEVVNFKLDESKIFVLPEGANIIPALRDNIKPDDITLVMDLGYVTNDLALFRGKSILGKFVKSSPKAGSTIVGLVRSTLADAGYKISAESAKEALETGLVRRGSKWIDVSAVVKEIKKSFVTNYIKEELIELFNVAGYNASEITNFVPMGGPMTPSETTGSIADMVVEHCGLSESKVIIPEGNPRHINIDMAYRTLEALMKRFAASANK